eukprot:GHVU01149073.1.p1 GENE.GHVU01149073.1~~GHVU01149073.1.p1  ORF type:complete len:130 (+),score=14.46 GHVU01149073.1:507-896(+)
MKPMSEQTDSRHRPTESEAESDSDVIFNDETNRALREWGRRLYAIGAGVLATVVTLLPAAVTAIRGVGWQFHLTVTLVVGLSVPVTAAYVAARTYGLSHHEVVCAARQAWREATAATATLGEHQRVEQP